MKKKTLKLSLYSFIISVVSFIINYVVFHYVTDDGFTTVHQEEAGKPFVADLIGQFATLFLFLSVASLLIYFIFLRDRKE